MTCDGEISARGPGVEVIAEVSANHGGDYDRAVEMIRQARSCGADTVKFQAYRADTLTIPCDNEYFQIDHPQWGGQSLYQLYERACTPLEWLGDLRKAADEVGIGFLCTAFDRAGVDLLEGLNVREHKIASFELVDIELIEYAASTGKPLILSTGMAELSEIADAVQAARAAGAGEITLLRCVSSYPADPDTMDLRTLPHMRDLFRCRVGLSDHSRGAAAAVCAVAMGAAVIEKHFALDDGVETPDSFFSASPAELRSLVESVRTARRALGAVRYGMTDAEKNNRVFRRSLFVVKDIRAGDAFDRANVRSIRPGYGLAPKHIGYVLGKKAARNIACGTPLSWELIKR